MKEVSQHWWWLCQVGDSWKNVVTYHFYWFVVPVVCPDDKSSEMSLVGRSSQEHFCEFLHFQTILHKIYTCNINCSFSKTGLSLINCTGKEWYCPVIVPHIYILFFSSVSHSHAASTGVRVPSIQSLFLVNISFTVTLGFSYLHGFIFIWNWSPQWTVLPMSGWHWSFLLDYTQAHLHIFPFTTKTYKYAGEVFMTN